MLTFILLQIASAFIISCGVLALLWHMGKSKVARTIFRKKGVWIPLSIIILTTPVYLYSIKTRTPDIAMPMWMTSHAPGGLPPILPLKSVYDFFSSRDNFANVSDIGMDPGAVPAEPKAPDADGIVRFHIEVSEVIAEVAPGVYFNYWTYDKKVPGPMLRVREGDTIELTIRNSKTSLHAHNIDLHAVTGQGGGTKYSTVAPGDEKTFSWKALNPGLFIYHCAVANVSSHNSHGQYGLILVEPKEGLPRVDREFYLVQGELYTEGGLGKTGLTAFDGQALYDGIPSYITFNGRVEQTPRMKARAGETIRFYVGNGGVNLISSFHIIGEIFDTVFPNGSLGGATEHNTQAAQVLPGGSSIIEAKFDIGGKYVIVDHALARMNKGAWAVLEVEGLEDPTIFAPVNQTPSENTSSAMKQH